MEQERALVSVIIPVYNVKDYVRRCVDSVCNQTYSNLQILIIDDGSTDDSGNICDELAMYDSRIQVIHQENGGLSAARNTGLDHAKGEYIFFVDSDDWIEWNTIDGLYQQLQATESDIAACGIKYVYEKREEGAATNFTSGEKAVWEGREAVKQMIQTNNVCSVAWNKLYKRSLWKKVRFPIGKLHEDEFTTYKLLFCSKKVCFSPNLWYNYYQRQGSIMAEMNNVASLDKLDALLQRYDYFSKAGDTELKEGTLVEYLEYIKYLYRGNKENAFCKEIRRRYQRGIRMMKSCSFIRFQKRIALVLWGLIPY